MPIARRELIELCAAGAGTAAGLTILAPRVEARGTAADPVEAVHAGCPPLRDIRDQATARRPRHPSIRDLLRHQERLALAGVLMHVPGGHAEIHQVIANCPDYQPAVTDEHLRALGARPPVSCAMLQNAADVRWNLCPGPCTAIGRCHGTSPVHLALRARSRAGSPA